jgi:hypothetical protein
VYDKTQKRKHNIPSKTHVNLIYQNNTMTMSTTTCAQLKESSRSIKCCETIISFSSLTMTRFYELGCSRVCICWIAWDEGDDVAVKGRGGFLMELR